MRDNGDLVRQQWADEEEIATYLSLGVPTTIMSHDVHGRADTLTVDEAVEDAKDLVTGLFEDWVRLGNIINTHGKAVQKRWSKKTLEQRKKILLAAWPGMTEKHRPDIASLASVDLSEGEKVYIHKDWIYYPHINIEDLTRSRTFLVLLDSRTRCTPDTFANSDMNSIRVGMRYGTIKPEYLKGYTMHLIGQKTPDTYGRITCWKGNPESAHAWVTGIGAQPGDGLIILEIQRRILRFLLKCTELLLHDLALDNVGSVGSQSVTFRGLRGYFSTNEPSHLERLMEAPYETPDQFDFAHLHGLVNARRGEAEDHLWLLREDPAYFSEVLREAGENQHEIISIDQATQESALQAKSFWDRVIALLVCSVYRDVMFWNIVWQALQGLELLRQRHESAMLSGQRLPKEYRRALSHFAGILDEMVEVTTELSERAILGCRPFHKYFSIKNRNPEDRVYDVHARREVADHLWWLIHQLRIPGDLEVIGLPCLLDEIERLVGSDRNERDRLSPQLARVISDFSILAELQRQLGLSSPGGRIASAVPLSELFGTREKLLAPAKRVMKRILAMQTVGQYGLDMPSFCYPIDKRHTNVTNAQMRSAEEQLDRFWEAVDCHFIRRTGKTLHAQEGVKIESRKLARTREWVEPERLSATTDEASEVVAASLVLATLEERSERTIARDKVPPVREKLKTRAVVDVPSTAPPTSLLQIDQNGAATETKPAMTVKLSNRDRRSLSMLFRVPHEEGVAGELPWIDFLHVMTSLGFAVQRLDGSASLFSPVSGDLDQSVIFHEPHPVRKIPYHIARRHGRRLTRAFGWTAESFIWA